MQLPLPVTVSIKEIVVSRPRDLSLQCRRLAANCACVLLSCMHLRILCC